MRRLEGNNKLCPENIEFKGTVGNLRALGR